MSENQADAGEIAVAIGVWIVGHNIVYFLSKWIFGLDLGSLYYWIGYIAYVFVARAFLTVATMAAMFYRATIRDNGELTGLLNPHEKGSRIIFSMAWPISSLPCLYWFSSSALVVLFRGIF